MKFPNFILKAFLTITLVIAVTTVSAQKVFPNYYRYMDLASKADSLYNAGKFKTAAVSYLAAANVDVEKIMGISGTDMYYNAACSFSRSKQANQTFNCLQRLADQKYSEYDRIMADSDFIFVRGDKRWNNLLLQIKKNKENDDRKNLMAKQRTTVSTENTETVFYPYTEYEKQFLQNESLCFLSSNHQHFRLFFTGNSFASKHLEEIKYQLSLAFDRALSILDTSNHNRGINVILVDSPEELQELTGSFIHGGLACVGDDLVFFVCNNNRRWQFKHELFHLISNRIWGNTLSRLLNEGSAVFADNKCYYDNPVYSITSYLIKVNKIYSVQSLIDNFDGKAAESETIAYIESAAIFKYLYEKYGPEKVKALWIKGFSGFKSIYGISTEEFEKEWLNYIKSITPPEDIDLNNLLNNGCG